MNAGEVRGAPISCTTARLACVGSGRKDDIHARELQGRCVGLFTTSGRVRERQEHSPDGSRRVQGSAAVPILQFPARFV